MDVKMVISDISLDELSDLGCFGKSRKTVFQSFAFGSSHFPLIDDHYDQPPSISFFLSFILHYILECFDRIGASVTIFSNLRGWLFQFGYKIQMNGLVDGHVS